MTAFNRNSGRLHLLLLMGAGLLAGLARAETPAPPYLIAELKKAMAEPMITDGSRAARFVDQLDVLLDQGRLADLEPVLTELRRTVPPANQRAMELIEKLLASARTQLAEATAKQEAAYTAIEKEFVAKFEAEAPAADFDVLFARLDALLPVPANHPNARKVELLRSLITRWQDYLLQSARGNFQEMVRSLDDLDQQSNRLPLLPHDQLSHLLDGITDRVQQASRLRLVEATKKLATLIDSARSPADFDSLLAEMAQPLQVDGVVVPDGAVRVFGTVVFEFAALRRFTARWQDYFNQVAARNDGEAQNLLRELTTDGDFSRLNPAPRIAARLNSTAGLPDKPPAYKPPEPLIPYREMTIDKLDRLAAQLQAWRAVGVLPASQADMPAELLRLRSAVALVSNGAAATVITDANNPPKTRGRGGWYTDAFIEIEAEIMKRAFTQYLDAPVEVPPAKDETFDGYSTRLMDYGKKQKDWPLVYRVLVARQNLVPDKSGQSPDLMAYKFFISGLQQENAGFWPLAFQSYIHALEAGSPHLPRQEIDDRLLRIMTENPGEFARIFTSDPEARPAK